MEPDTHIILSLEVRFGDWPVLYQRWSWEGVRAKSLIFLDQDVAHLDDDELERTVRKSTLVHEGSSITMRRQRNGYTFVNFNFET